MIHLCQENLYTSLSDEQVGKLVKAMFRYANDGEVVLSGDKLEEAMLYGIFLTWQNQYDQEENKYIERALEKREKDNKRYLEKKAKRELDKPIDSDDYSQEAETEEGGNDIKKYANELAERYGGWYKIANDKEVNSLFYAEIRNNYGEETEVQVLRYFVEEIQNGLPF